jgi:serine/threonine protein kinase/tetratricopeptide (TPR) repeat protein
MTPERWRQVNQLFHSALEREQSQRVAFLAEACAGDEDLRRQVESLIESHELPGSFIEEPPSDLAAELLADRLELEAGQEISHYKITTLLGKGGMGEVYQARDTRLGRPVALKLLPVQFTDATRVKRFEQEARAASALNHPNIVTVYEIGKSNSSHFIATEFIDGKNLVQHMTGGRMPVDEILGIAAQVAAALAAAHERAILHRDIKPENIMLRRDGLVKVVDFGLAKLTSQRQAMVDRSDRVLVKTNPGVLLGTVKYMSPEQARGGELDNRTDLWSLGVVLYEMVTGHAPFEGETLSHTIISIIENQQLPLTHYAEAPAELERIVQKLLRKDKRERYQTASDLALDLKSLKQELEIRARLKHSNPESEDTVESNAGPAQPISSTGETFGQIKRSRWALTLAMAAAIVAVSIGAFFLLNLSHGAITSLVVLPFENASGDTEVESVADGICEGIIDRLSGVLTVKSFNSVRHYKGQQIDAQAIGRQLGTEAVLTGKVVQRGEILDVNIELVDVRDNRHLWGDRYYRKRSAIILLQDDIANDISKKLGLRLSVEDQKRLIKHYTENADAEELDMKGRFYFDKRTVDGINRSKEYFRAAIHQDPSYPLPYAGLANALTPSDLVFAPQNTRTEAGDAAAMALGLDDTLAEAHTAEARVQLFYDLKWKEAEKQLQLTIRSHPNNAEAHHMYSHYLMYVGQTKQSLDEALEALRIDKDDPLLNVHLGWTYLYARQYDKAIAQMRKAVDMDHTFFRAHLFLGRAYEQSGMYKQALDEYNEAAQLERGSHETLPALGHLYAVSGNASEARRTLNELNVLSAQHKVSAYDLAIVYAGLGENDMVFDHLEKALRERTGGVLMLKAELIFDSFQADRRYKNLLQQMNLPVE